MVVVVDIVAHVRADVADLSGTYSDVHAELSQHNAATLAALLVSLGCVAVEW